MALKDWLNNLSSGSGKSGTRGGSAGDRLSIDDLITLERYDEALAQLKKKVARNKSDYRSRIQLADVYLKTSKATEAIEEYLSIADRYASEGFFDKGYALVAKLARMMPHEDRLQGKMSALRRAKRLEHLRQVIVNSLATKTWAIEIRQHWSDLIRGPLVELLSEAQLEKVFPLFEITRLKEGEVLVERGAQTPVLYLILTGELVARVPLASGSTDLRAFQSGDIVGDQALLRKVPWPASYRAAKTPTKLLSLDRKGLEQALLGEEDPKGLLNFLGMQSHDTEVADAVAKLKAVKTS